ncbi:MAG: hypothetical protein ACJ72H_00100 [Candidatus Sulfotelmatobacter sp.]
MSEENFAMPARSSEAAYQEAAPTMSFVDLALPTAGASVVVAMFLLISPGWSVQAVADQLAKGHLVWIIAALAVVINVGVCINSLRRKLLTILGLVEVSGLVAVVAIVALVFQSSFAQTPINPRLFFPSGTTELFAYCYFTFIIALCLPSLVTTLLAQLAERLIAPAPTILKKPIKGR